MMPSVDGSDQDALETQYDAENPPEIDLPSYLPRGTSTNHHVIRTASRSQLRNSLEPARAPAAQDDRAIRASDIDDNAFEHEDIFSDSRYLTRNKDKKRGMAKKLFAEKSRSARFMACVAATFIVSVTILLSITMTAGNGSDEDLLKVKYQGSSVVTGFPNAVIPQSVVDNLSEWRQDLELDTHVPYFWHVALAGGRVVEDVLGQCLNLVQASEAGMLEEGEEEEVGELREVIIYGETFVNVDVTTPAGIARAKNLNFASSGLADVVFTPMFHDAVPLFNPPDNPGRFFAMFRHPVERAANMYFYLGVAKWDPMYNPDLKGISLEEYGVSNYIENNHMVRILTNHTGGSLTLEDLELAKEIVRRKCLVGLYDQLDKSLQRFTNYFGWNVNQRAMSCQNRVQFESKTRFNYPTIDPGSKAYALMMAQNRFDAQLYEFAKELFEYQGAYLEE